MAVTVALMATSTSGGGATEEGGVEFDAADEVEDGLAVRVGVLHAGAVGAFEVHLRERVDGDGAEELAEVRKAGERASGDASAAGFLAREGFGLFEQEDAEAGLPELEGGGGAGGACADDGDIVEVHSLMVSTRNCSSLPPGMV